MNDLPNLYPAPQKLTADRRAAVRSTVVWAVAAPTPSRPWIRRRIAAIALSIGAAAVLAVLGLLQPWVTPAATWASVPERADAATTASLGSACTAGITARHFPMSVAAATPVLAETRGTSTAVLLASPSQVQICVTGPGGEFDSLGVYQVEPLSATGRGVVDGIPGSRQGGNPLRVIFGRLDSGTDMVTVKTTDGLSVTASVATSGTLAYFLAWWPSHADASRVVITAPAGVTGDLSLPDQSVPSPIHR